MVLFYQEALKYLSKSISGWWGSCFLLYFFGLLKQLVSKRCEYTNHSKNKCWIGQNVCSGFSIRCSGEIEQIFQPTQYFKIKNSIFLKKKKKKVKESSQKGSLKSREKEEYLSRNWRWGDIGSGQLKGTQDTHPGSCSYGDQAGEPLKKPGKYSKRKNWL